MKIDLDQSDIFLSNMDLSHEARSIVASGILKGKFQEVSTQFTIESKFDFSTLIVNEIIKACWGDLIECYADVSISKSIDKINLLSIVQDNIINGTKLVSVRFTRFKDIYCFYISINHALADETTLSEIKYAIESVNKYGISETLNKLRDYSEEYKRYVRSQVIQIENIDKDLVNEGSTPAKIRHDGPLSWNVNKAFSVVRSRQTFPTKQKAMDCTIKWLHGEKILYKGNFVCSSKNWRKGRSVGMQTGLVPKFLNGEDYSQYHCLEHLAKISPEYKELFNKCVSSEIFINGSAPRSIECHKKKSRSFPVGIDFYENLEGTYEIVLEGRFSNRVDLIRSLEKVSKYVS
ncbi:hypothetical protein VIBNISOn1_p0067 [Vibrio nigripulchritudo SOn1]|uniref:Condensation domain-containing protein n=1 Tax=Vibrio nigripulchritudo SOn1 TaxID=1238450 RepID=A0AAV2VZN8_9VIBR|nr:hypothetical protein [Vibrio nigripulchritudo]CCO50230.1 hypothetical protein VIBNISOn1_p0067 [Vibrio nigripulchritudo SOn1]